MRKYGGFIPGIRPGKRTADFINEVLTRITLVGALYLIIISFIPEWMITGIHLNHLPFWLGGTLFERLPVWVTNGLGVNFYFGGTSLLIVVGVAMDTVTQIEAQLIMRYNVAQGREVGVAAKAVMAGGELVSDDLVCEMVRLRLKEPDCKRGYVLDGFPRTAAQAGWLDALLDDKLFDNSRPTRAWPIVIRLDVDYNQLLLRITGRRSCPTCGRIYNVHFQPPRVADICDLE